MSDFGTRIAHGFDVQRSRRIAIGRSGSPYAHDGYAHKNLFQMTTHNAEQTPSDEFSLQLGRGITKTQRKIAKEPT